MTIAISIAILAATFAFAFAINLFCRRGYTGGLLRLCYRLLLHCNRVERHWEALANEQRRDLRLIADGSLPLETSKATKQGLSAEAR